MPSSLTAGGVTPMTAHTTTMDNAKPEDIATWEPVTRDMELSDGDILRTPLSDDKPDGPQLYAICTGGGFGCSANSRGNAMFMRNESRSLADTLNGKAQNEPRWERYFTLHKCTNPDEVRRFIKEETAPVAFDLELDAPKTDEVPNAGVIPAMLVDETHGSMLVIAYNLECAEPFAIVMRQGRLEPYARNINGRFEPMPKHQTCGTCYRPVPPNEGKTISLLGNNTTTCTDCHAE